MELFEKKDVQSEPSYNPSCEVSQVAASDYIYNVRKRGFDVCIPAIVKEYNRKENVVTVVPAINEWTATDEYIERAEIKVPVFSFSGGGFMINFPLVVGDTGWLLACDRDISLFKQQLTQINPNTARTHCIEDSFFFPDKVNKFNIDKGDENNFVVQSLTRNLKLSFSKDAIKIYAGAPKKDGQKEEKEQASLISLTQGEIAITTTEKLTATVKNANISAEENLTAKAKQATIEAQTINLKGKVVIDGNVEVSGNVTASEVKGGGISLKSHTHSGVEPGSGNTGGPQ